MMSEFLDSYRTLRWCCRACANNTEEECRCAEAEYLAFEQWEDQWGNPIRCCVRAGLDVASSPSAGVVGFSAGDVRTMYPEGVPSWVFAPDEQLQHWLSGVLNGLFCELPDDARLVL
jgi:hypothetical protein